jgi:hypothetical protein
MTTNLWNTFYDLLLLSVMVDTRRELLALIYLASWLDSLEAEKREAYVVKKVKER